MSASGQNQFIPTCHLSAWYGLMQIGTIASRSEPKILVHAGASAFGQVAIRTALALGVGPQQIFSTVGGVEVEEQRGILTGKFGLPPSNIFDVKSAHYLRLLLATTCGGVDVVYDFAYQSLEKDIKATRKGENITPPPLNKKNKKRKKQTEKQDTDYRNAGV